jgi:hypothetical protein
MRGEQQTPKQQKDHGDGISPHMRWILSDHRSLLSFYSSHTRGSENHIWSRHSISADCTCTTRSLFFSLRCVSSLLSDIRLFISASQEKLATQSLARCTTLRASTWRSHSRQTHLMHMHAHAIVRPESSAGTRKSCNRHELVRSGNIVMGFRAQAGSAGQRAGRRAIGSSCSVVVVVVVPKSEWRWSLQRQRLLQA